jgi:hypothetical protein
MNLDPAAQSLIDQLNTLAASSLSGGYGSLPKNLDDREAKLIKAAIDCCRNIRNRDGNVQPFWLPPVIALAVVRALETLLVADMPTGINAETPPKRPAPSSPEGIVIEVAPDPPERDPEPRERRRPSPTAWKTSRAMTGANFTSIKEKCRLCGREIGELSSARAP